MTTCRRPWAIAALVAVAFAACSGDDQEEPAAGTELKVADAVVSSTTTSAAERQVPPMTGDAAQNESCRLATVAEIESQVEAGVTEVRGVTAPGAYGENGLSCAWYLDSTDVGIPSVLVQWEFPIDAYHDAVIDLYHDEVDQGLATPVEGIGEFAVFQGSTVETVSGTDLVRVSLVMHPEPTETDRENAIVLLRLMLSRAAER